MNKRLNFGCGSRFADGWENIDFYSSGPEVRRVNLLQGFPYPAMHFDAVYSSHVLEHFTKHQCLTLLRECFRVLKPGGIVRAVVPDIGVTIDEYQRVRNMPDADGSKAEKYRWIMIELLDQLVRSERHGEWGKLLKSLEQTPSSELATYVRDRLLLSDQIHTAAPHPRIFDKLKGIRQKVASRSVYWWLQCVRLLVPPSIRSSVFVNTSIGERHLWMYDDYGMSQMLADAGFVCISRKRHDESEIFGFLQDLLDANADGSPYKALSLYMEAKRPLG